MTRYIFHAEQQPDLRVPYPVAVTEDGSVIEGRPDARRLVGFQRGMQLGIARIFDEALAGGIDWTVGKFPVYTHMFGDGFFVVLEKIEMVEVVERELLGL